VNVFYSDHYVVELPAGHRFPMGKYAMLRRALVERGVVAATDLVAAQWAERAQIVRVHDADYVDAFIAGRVDPKIMREIGLPWSPHLVERTLASAGGTLGATYAALRDGIAGNLAGGTHHAHRARGSGFCVFNDLAIGAADALATGAVDQVLIFDADVHQGDGTATIFAGDMRVLTVSIHGAHNFPFRKARSDVDIELPDDAGDDAYLDAVHRAWHQAIDRARPELVLYQAGVDALEADKLGRLSVTPAGLEARDRFVLGAAREAGLPIVLTLGGGYAQPLDPSIDAHVTTYRVAYSLFAIRPS
jgi:acetoin utilization deacetylase AcuC-like enzyme